MNVDRSRAGMNRDRAQAARRTGLRVTAVAAEVDAVEADVETAQDDILAAQAVADQALADAAAAQADADAALTGDVTKALGGTVLTIANDAVTFAKMQNSAAAGLSVLGRSTNSAGDLAEINAGTDGHVLRRSGTTLGFGTVTTGGIAAGAVSFDRMQDMEPNRILGNSQAGAGSIEEIRSNTLSPESPTSGSIFMFWNESGELRSCTGADLGIP